MKERRELNELVILFIKDSGYNPTASEIFQKLSEKNNGLLYKEGIYSVRSLSKVIKGFDNILRMGEKGSPLIYKVKS